MYLNIKYKRCYYTPQVQGTDGKSLVQDLSDLNQNKKKNY